MGDTDAMWVAHDTIPAPTQGIYPTCSFTHVKLRPVQASKGAEIITITIKSKRIGLVYPSISVGINVETL